jgi:predicted DNA-binding transcriptional regulator AlpA
MSCPGLAVDAAEAARLFGISQSHLYLLKRTGRFGPAPVRLGRAVRYPCQELEEWMAAGFPPRQKWEEMKRAAGRR